MDEQQWRVNIKEIKVVVPFLQKGMTNLCCVTK